MAFIKITIPKQRQFQRMLEKMPDVVNKEIYNALDKSVHQIHRDVVKYTPVDTTYLRDSLAPRVSRKLIGTIGLTRPVTYALDVHNLHPVGQRYRRPSKNKLAVAGFMIVATEKNKAKVKGFFEDALKKITRQFKL